VYTLEALGKEELRTLIDRSLQQDSLLQEKQLTIEEDNALLRLSGGDARKLYNLLELIADAEEESPITVTNDKVMHYAQQKMALYDKEGEQHYDIISAFIKSVRGSDPNAALYWLARMLEGGEDPKFIARRLIILASEDIGNANPTGLVLATNCFQAIERIGMPEGELVLSQVTAYLASSPKSNATYEAIKKAKKTVKKTGDLEVPLHLRNAPTDLMKEKGYGADYKYSHNYEQHFTPQQYLPESLEGRVFYEPSDNKREQQIRKYLKKLWGDKYEY
jgi:putative ATPase